MQGTSLNNQKSNLCCVTNEILKEEEEVNLEENMAITIILSRDNHTRKESEKELGKFPASFYQVKQILQFCPALKSFWQSLAVTTHKKHTYIKLHFLTLPQNATDTRKLLIMIHAETCTMCFFFFFPTLTHLDSRNHSYPGTFTGIQVLSELNYIESGSQIYSTTQKH